MPDMASRRGTRFPDPTGIAVFRLLSARLAAFNLLTTICRLYILRGSFVFCLRTPHVGHSPLIGRYGSEKTPIISAAGITFQAGSGVRDSNMKAESRIRSNVRWQWYRVKDISEYVIP